MFWFYLADIFLKYRRKMFKVEIALAWGFSHLQLLFGTKCSAIKGPGKSHDEILARGSQWIWQCRALPVPCRHAAALRRCQPRAQELPSSGSAPCDGVSRGGASMCLEETAGCSFILMCSLDRRSSYLEIRAAGCICLALWTQGGTARLFAGRTKGKNLQLWRCACLLNWVLGGFYYHGGVLTSHTAKVN